MAAACDNTPLLLSQSAPSLPVKRTVWTAVAHSDRGDRIGSVMSLAWSIAQLGWVADPFSMLLIASTTLFSSFLLCNTYRSPHPEFGPHRSASYLDVVNLNLGVKNGWLCGLLVGISLYGFGLAFVITSAISKRCVIHLSYWFLSHYVISISFPAFIYGCFLLQNKTFPYEYVPKISLCQCCHQY